VSAGVDAPVSEIDEQMASRRLLETCWLIARASTVDEIWDIAQIALEQATAARVVRFLPDDDARLAPVTAGESAELVLLIENVEAGWYKHARPDMFTNDESRVAAVACAGKTNLWGAIALEAEPGATISPSSCLMLAAIASSVGQAIDAVELNAHSFPRLVHDQELAELRSSLGRALHDGPSQDMATALLALEHLVRTKTVITNAPASVELALSTLEAAIVSLRKFMGALRGEEQVDVVSSFPIGAGEFPSESQEQAAMSIVNEALHNISKHAGAHTVQITIHRERHGIDVIIEDDGTGFVPSAFPGHFGLEQMRERAAISGGDLSIKSVPGSGTEVRFSIPAKSAWRSLTVKQSPELKCSRDSDVR
jgi:signal transduction histidine kinase